MTKSVGRVHFASQSHILDRTLFNTKKLINKDDSERFNAILVLMERTF